ncbi:MAG TPA: hypothetical protein VKY24_22650 [Reyranella sp.]|nr:hypothetical protein [Reyranella sp.]
MPSMVELIGAMVGLLVLTGASWIVVGKIEDVGAAKVAAADQKALLEQQAKDAKLSAEIVANQAAEIAALQDKAQTVITRIVNAPSTSGCGPVMRDASRGLHELFQYSRTTNAGREPTATMPGSAARR